MAPSGSRSVDLAKLSSGDRPSAGVLHGVHMIQPSTQGDHDGLCGLYCIINAVRLVSAPHRQLTHDEVRALFGVGVRFLARQGCLSKSVRACISERVWPSLAKRIVTAAQPLMERSIILQEPILPIDAPFNETLRHIEAMIDSGKAPCVFLRGKYRHYSVISGYTPISLRLFDSFGYCWVRRISCGSTAGPMCLHRFHVESLITLSMR